MKLFIQLLNFTLDSGSSSACVPVGEGAAGFNTE